MISFPLHSHFPTVIWGDGEHTYFVFEVLFTIEGLILFNRVKKEKPDFFYAYDLVEGIARDGINVDLFLF